VLGGTERHRMITVIGDWMRDVDLFYRIARASPEGPWPVVHQIGQAIRPGGAGAVARMVAAMGVPVTAAGVLSKPVSVKRRLFVNHSQIIRIDDDMVQDITSTQAAQIARSIVTDIVLVADYGKGMITSALWDVLKYSGKRLIVDPSRARPLAWYAGAYAIVPNRSESRVGHSLSQAIGRCRELKEIFPNVCIKLDRDGMIASGGARSQHISAECHDPTDVCGAGDMVLAALGVGMARGLDWIDACKFANAMAGAKCRRHGASPPVVA
jgi:bifunctional ADP-heptose synthase (sugar kinase/adenylyltransferase)